MEFARRTVIPDYVHHVKDDVGNTVVLNNKVGRVYGLYGVAALIWDAMSRGESEAEIAESIVGRYKVSTATAVDDIRKFLERLVAAELVQLAD